MTFSSENGFVPHRYLWPIEIYWIKVENNGIGKILNGFVMYEFDDGKTLYLDASTFISTEKSIVFHIVTCIIVVTSRESTFNRIL